MGKLKDYQVIDVLNGGTFYKVRHKVTNNIFAWKAYNCSAYSDQQIQIIAKEVKLLSKVLSASLLRYHETILHAPSKTLYFVLEYNPRRSVHELIATCKATDKFISEPFVWRLLFELARVCKVVEDLNFVTLAKCITETSIFVDEDGELRIDCFELSTSSSSKDNLMRQVGDVLHSVCYQPGVCDDDKIKQFHYSNDLRSIISFITDNRETILRPDVILYHPTVLANLEPSQPKKISEILLSVKSFNTSLVEINKCDSDKAVELSQQSPNAQSVTVNSPIYGNIISKRKYPEENEQSHSDRSSLSPTLAALALELPGFVPRSRKAISGAVEVYANPKHVSEVTLSQQWMSRLIALRQREESLNKRERDIIAKEMVNSPNVKIVPFKDTSDQLVFDSESNGITLPPIINQVSEETVQESRRRQRRRNPLKTNNRRKTFAYEDLDSSLSADTGDGSIIVTAKKITKDNMPCRNIFSDLSTKKVQFTSANPFVESDESVTLTFYDLENVECNRYQIEKCDDKVSKDITKFKYLDLEKDVKEKRATIGWGQSSPSKQVKVREEPFNSIMRKTPSKTSLTSKGSCSSRYSMMSARSHWSTESAQSKTSDGNVSDRTRSGVRQSFAPVHSSPPKRKVRKSLLPFKTPFKFNKTSTRV